MYTNQEAFDLVVTKLVAQGKPSFDEFSERCLYQDEQGNRCAAGHLIPDNLINLAISNGKSWKLLINTEKRFESIVDPEFMEELQQAHDTSVLYPKYRFIWREGWTSTMLLVATKYNLDPSKLLELATSEWQRGQ